MAPSRSWLRPRPFVASALVAGLGAASLAASPADAAYVVTGAVLGQVCTDAANKATCLAPFAIDEIIVGDKPVDLTAVPAVTEVEGANCRVRVGARASAPDPEMQPLMTAKYMVDTHDKVDAVPVDYLVFACRPQ
jgi:hypothetical protein